MKRDRRVWMKRSRARLTGRDGTNVWLSNAVRFWLDEMEQTFGSEGMGNTVRFWLG